MAISEADLRRILTTEERNVLVMMGRAHGADERRLAARSLNMPDARVQELLDRARAKIERETRKGGRGVTTVTEEVECLCGVEFTPRRKGELQCPACRELNGDGRPLIEPRARVGEDPVESVHEPVHEPVQSGEASGNGSGDHADVARNPMRGRAFRREVDVEVRRGRVIAQIEKGQITPRDLATQLDCSFPTVHNDLMRLHADGKIVKVKLDGRSVAYRMPTEHEVFALAPPYVVEAPESEVKSQETLDRGDDAATPEEAERIANAFEWPDPPAGWRYADGGPNEDGKRTVERIDDGQQMKVDEVAAEAAATAPAAESDDPPLHHFDLPDPEERSRSLFGDGLREALLEPGVEPPAIDVLRQRAADTAQQLMAEAERLAEAADMAVPETLLRARYIAALLGRIEAGDTSPDLLDRFERLAFAE